MFAAKEMNHGRSCAGGGSMQVRAGAAKQVDVVRSLGWMVENMLPLLLPVEVSWQPQDFLPCSAAALGASTEDEALALSTIKEGVAKLPAGPMRY
jgi:hypothetical protein